jgi:CheY-like chemotaxis protein
VARHGGEIAVESEVGKGTAFTIWLPVAQTAEIAPETVAGPPPETPPPAPALGTRVLVVDDSDEVLEVLREVLDRHGCTAVTYPDGESALREIERDRIDVAMLDLTLPGISGLEVATRVTQRWPGATVAIMTGHFDGIDPDDARAKGIHFVLSKPFRLAEIRSVLDHAHTGVPG